MSGSSPSKPPSLQAAKRRLIREADEAEREGRQGFQRVSLGLHAGSAVLGMLMGHRGTRSRVLPALSLAMQTLRFFTGGSSSRRR